MKLIIDIPENYYELMKHEVEHHITDYRPFVIIANGIQLDDIKAEIETLQSDTNVMMYCLAISDVLEIIDKHIGKAESEDK